MPIKAYYSLTKPGIIYSNTLIAAAGFFLASKGQINYWLLLAVLVGIGLVIACGCVFNNYLDRQIDQKMERTKKRALASGLISGQNALIFGTILGFLGFLVLIIYTNLLTVTLGAVALFFYVVVYGIWKRRSVYGTLVGSISGALPPVAGYCAVSNRLDLGALLLFVILVCWQMPHFYAIAIYRAKDYQAALIPVLPVKKGILLTKINMLFYILAFIIASLMLTVLGFTGNKYFVVMAVVGLVWLGLCLKGFGVKNNELWARRMFILSLVIIMSFFVFVSLDVVIPT